MSTHWDLYCVDCDEGFGFDWNHGEKEVAQFLRADIRGWLESIPAGFRWPYQFEKGSAISLGLWYRQHRGHVLRVRNEYGRYLEECTKWVSCHSCDKEVPCRLPVDHDGACQVKSAE